MDDIDIYNEKKHELDENINLYAQTLKREDPKKISFLKKFLTFCIENERTVNKASTEEFMRIRGYKSQPGVTYLNVFRKFCEKNELKGYWYQLQKPSKYKIKHPILLKYITECELTNEKTKKTYFSILNSFFNYLTERNIPLSVEAFNKYRQICLSNNISVSTLNIRLAAMKSFGSWLMDKDDLKDETISLFKKSFVHILRAKNYRTNKDRYHNKALSEDERDSVMNKIESLEEKLVISLQAYEGLRPGELYELLVEDIELHTEYGFMDVFGRGGKQKIRIFKVTSILLQQFIGERKEGYLFKKMTRIKVYKIVKKYLPEYKPICLRHTAAQIMVEKNVPIGFVNIQMRHASMTTTYLYVAEQNHKKFLESVPRNILD
jgi:integrase